MTRGNPKESEMEASTVRVDGSVAGAVWDRRAAVVPYWLPKALDELTQSTTTAVCLRVFIALHEWTYDRRHDAPTVDVVAAVAGVAERSVTRALGMLCAVGALSVDPRAPNTYVLHYRSVRGPGHEAMLRTVGA
jgi:hypothetical protein